MSSIFLTGPFLILCSIARVARFTTTATTGTAAQKANRLRGFWAEESNYKVGRLLSNLLDYAVEIGVQPSEQPLLAECRRIAARLLQDTPVPELDALEPISSERDFETLAKAAREAIEKNQPEAGLDRLHTFVLKYLRSLCTARGLIPTRDKPLHSVFGEYVGALRKSGLIDSPMTGR